MAKRSILGRGKKGSKESDKSETQKKPTKTSPAKSTVKEEKKAETTTSSTKETKEPEMAAEQDTATQPESANPNERVVGTFAISTANLDTTYINFCRVSSTPEELILDVGLNPDPFSTGQHEIEVTNRIIMNHYSAKRLLAGLTQTIENHEKTFGKLETDVRKRVNVSAFQ